LVVAFVSELFILALGNHAIVGARALENRGSGIKLAPVPNLLRVVAPACARENARRGRRAVAFIRRLRLGAVTAAVRLAEGTPHVTGGAGAELDFTEIGQVAFLAA
jgi:hypothetical protein